VIYDYIDPSHSGLRFCFSEFWLFSPLQWPMGSFQSNCSPDQTS